MHVFDDPMVVIASFAIGSVLLAVIGFFLAARGIKAAEGYVEKAFISIGKMENDFKKAEKHQSDRCVFHISISSDNFLSANLVAEIYTELKKTLLNTFASGKDVSISMSSDKSYIVFAKWDAKKAVEKIESCCAQINTCLTGHRALNVVEIRIGCYMDIITGISFDEAINRAKQACLLARNEKRSYVIWNPTRVKDLAKQIKIENNIEKQIDSNRFFLEYQPVIDVKTRKIVGAEVLARLRSENDGVLQPSSFLGAVDSLGLQRKFDYYIFEKNCKWISNDKRQREGYQYTINFSRLTLSEPTFVEKVVGIAQKYGLNLSCLAVEILEDKDLTGAAKERMIKNLSELKEKGMAVLLDDFGSGFTKFGDLQSLNISIVKIDKAITQNAVTETGFIILKNIINTSRDIGFKTLCEGIETEQQEKAAIKAGCDFLQGFYYYRPMPVTSLEKLLENRI